MNLSMCAYLISPFNWLPPPHPHPSLLPSPPPPLHPSPLLFNKLFKQTMRGEWLVPYSCFCRLTFAQTLMQIPHPANCCSARTNTRMCSVYIATPCFFSSSSPSFLLSFFSDRPMTNAWKMAGNILSVEEAIFFMVQRRSIFF